MIDNDNDDTTTTTTHNDNDIIIIIIIIIIPGRPLAGGCPRHHQPHGEEDGHPPELIIYT